MNYIRISFIVLTTFIFFKVNGQNDTLQIAKDLVRTSEDSVFIKKDNADATSTISSKEISYTVNPTLGYAIQGRAAGVFATPISGRPGADAQIIIRGPASLSYNPPLYVVDGIIMSQRDFNLINPMDIESIEVLKDASATALYGFRGANGVILINTKRLEKRGIKINFSTYQGVQVLRKRLDLLENKEYLGLIHDIYSNANRPIPEILKDTSANPYIHNNTDWQKEIFRPAGISNYFLQGQVGNDKIKTSISGGYFRQKGILINTNFERFSLGANSEFKVTKFLVLGETFLLGNTKTENGYGDNTIYYGVTAPPILPVRDPNHSTGYMIPSEYGLPNLHNPIALNAFTEDKEKSNRLLGSVYAEVSFLKFFKFRTSVSGDLGRREGARKEIPMRFIYRRESTFLEDFSMIGVENRLSLEKVVARDHAILSWINVGTQKYKLSYEQPNIPGISTTGFPTSIIKNDFNYIIGSLQYIHKNRYSITSNFRAEKYTGIKDAPYNLSPSIAFGWKVNEEKFLKNINWINLINIRGSYGRLFRSYSDLPLPLVDMPHYPHQGWNSQSLKGAYISKNNDNIREYTKQANFGSDIIFFNKINITLDLFSKTSSRVWKFPVPSLSGFGTAAGYGLGNIRTQNNGLEMSIGYKEKLGKLEFFTSANFTYIRNKVLELEEIYYPFNKPEEPYPYSGQFQGYETQGIYQNESEIDKGHNRKRSNAADQNSQIFTPSFKPGLPKVLGGITGGIVFKNVDFTFFLQGIWGNKIYNNLRGTLESMNSNANQSKSVIERWRNNNFPNSAWGDPNLYRRSINEEDGSYVNIKNIEVGYSFPKIIFFKTEKTAPKVRIYLSAQNVFMFTRYKGYDPSFSVFNYASLGIDNGVYPQPRMFLGGLQIGF